MADLPPEALPEIDDLFAGIADGTRHPYETCGEIQGLASKGMIEDARLEKLYLTLAWLADEFEIGREPYEKMEERMRRFAVDWTMLPRDERSRREMLRRWMHDELGYEDPPPKSEGQLQREHHVAALKQNYRQCRCDRLVRVPEDGLGEDSRIAIAAYIDPSHMTWIDKRMYRCQRTGWLWQKSSSSLERVGK